ncbi:glycoside hydrolase family 3 C-terminal domain-containing protein [Croceibacterium ferulae]|uniref:glycoside hydrolase family 3 C-terminal domain-containing protein n=1 Tax=Croceibacterium ferulae TaxID=1854641 RepID=UPI0019D417A3|nr:glycoside hydrolase family 3 C-terminal domain-containing protein [Croceibacterium ferulae]
MARTRAARIGACVSLGAMIAATLLSPASQAQEQSTAAQAAAVDAGISNAQAQAAAIVAQMSLEEKASQIKDDSPAVARLGIPGYNWWSEGLHGVARAGEATVFPQAIGMAATWDVPLIRRTADVIASEFRAKYLATRKPDGSSAQYQGLTVWSPNVNIFRDPRWGRGQETWGEDPFLTSRFGVAFIEGLQGDDPQVLKTVATVKHFAVHSGPEADRHRDDIHPSAHDLEDTYLPAFRAAVQEARVEGLMCAYNAVDGIPACASPMLEGIVRTDWGFRGHIVSDCAAIADFFLETSHRWQPDPEHTVAAAINAGTDLFCREFGRDKSSDPAIIVRAVQQGLLSEAALDQAVTRLVAARIRLGLIGDVSAQPYASITADQFDTPENAALAAEVARASMVLLKNDGLLPLTAAPRRIAVVGPNADSVEALVGNYNGTPSQPVTVLAGIRARFPDAEVTYVEGTGLTGTPLKEVGGEPLGEVRMEVFDNPDLAGTPVVTTEEAVRFSWGQPVRADRAGSVRWSGTITAPTSGPYQFQLRSFDGYRILVDGQEIVNAWDAGEPGDIVSQEAQLTAGTPVPIVVEARQSGTRGEQVLLWSAAETRGDAALAAARDADLVVYVAGLNARLEGEEMRVNAAGFAGGDRTSLDLPAPQQELLEQLHAAGKPVVLVLMNGSGLAVNWADANVPAIIEAWYPGGPGGRAVADLIAGDYSPSGRLPVTFYRSAEELPPFKDYAMANRTYRYFDGEVLYPFGHGLSYTSFAYQPVRLSQSRVAAGAPVQASVRVRNNGMRDGAEVVQLYVTHDAPGAPRRALRAFQRVQLARGEEREVTFTLDAEALSMVDAQGRRLVPEGTIGLWIGGGQPDARDSLPAVAGVAAQLQVTGEHVIR